MRPIRTPAALALSMLWMLSASAGAAPDCANAVSTPDLNACAAAEQKAVEAKLNRVYQGVIKSLDGEGRESAAARTKLVGAQRLWVKFREADCDAVFERHAGGTIRTVMYIGCMRSHAEERIKALEAFGQGH